MKMTLTVHVWIHKRDLVDGIMQEPPQSTPIMSYVNNITSSLCVIESRPTFGDSRDPVPPVVTIFNLPPLVGQLVTPGHGHYVIYLAHLCVPSSSLPSSHP